jgi:uncharacterized linocin/CFP29 family protein
MIPDKNAALVGWTDDQWNQVVTAVTTEAQKARLAASFLPVVGPVDPVTVAVPALTLSQPPLPQGVAMGEAPVPNRLAVDSHPNLNLATVSVLVYLHRHEVADPDLAAALNMFRRAANAIARVEDFIIFNGAEQNITPIELANLVHVSLRQQDLWHGLLWTPNAAVSAAATHPPTVFDAIVQAVANLEGRGYFGPFACVLGDNLFKAASSPTTSLISVRDRLLPYLDGLLFRSSAIEADSGVVVALGGNPVELVLARDIDVNFIQINTEPRWVFRISERMALRAKDRNALQRLGPMPDAQLQEVRAREAAPRNAEHRALAAAVAQAVAGALRRDRAPKGQR